MATPGERAADSLAALDNSPNWRKMWNPRQSMSLTSTKGLLNGPGDNNCFVNSAVQVGIRYEVSSSNEHFTFDYLQVVKFVI